MLPLEQAPVSERSRFRAPIGLTVEQNGDGTDAVDDVVLSFPLASRRPQSVRLTPAESEIFRDISRGSSNTAIAARRGVSVRTVANQMAQLFRKLGVHSRLDAVLVAGHWPRPEQH